MEAWCPYLYKFEHNAEQATEYRRKFRTYLPIAHASTARSFWSHESYVPNALPFLTGSQWALALPRVHKRLEDLDRRGKVGMPLELRRRQEYAHDLTSRTVLTQLSVWLLHDRMQPLTTLKHPTAILRHP